MINLKDLIISKQHRIARLRSLAIGRWSGCGAIGFLWHVLIVSFDDIHFHVFVFCVYLLIRFVLFVIAISWLHAQEFSHLHEAFFVLELLEVLSGSVGWSCICASGGGCWCSGADVTWYFWKDGCSFWSWAAFQVTGEQLRWTFASRWRMDLLRRRRWLMRLFERLLQRPCFQIFNLVLIILLYKACLFPHHLLEIPNLFFRNKITPHNNKFILLNIQ